MRTIINVGLLLCGSLGAFAADKTITGQITDTMCGASHQKMAHGAQKMSAHDCTLACVKNGSKYAVVSRGKVYEVSNQDAAGLSEHAGHTVKVTGEVSADGKSITVSKIEMAAAKKKNS